MKKLIVVALLVLFCAGCAPAQRPDNPPEVSKAPKEGVGLAEIFEESTAAGKNAVFPADFSAAGKNEAYSYANMQRNVPSGNFMDYVDKVMFTWLVESVPGSGTGAFRLFVMDKDTGEVRTFCEDSSCPHTATECYAANATSNVEAYGGKMYALNGSAGDIMELKEGRFEKIAGRARYFWHGENRLFAVTWDNSLVEIVDGEQPQVLLGEYIDYGNVIFDGYLYGQTAEGVSRVDLSEEELRRELVFSVESYCILDGRHIYYYGEDGLLYRCDMEGKNPELVVAQHTSAISFDEDYLYFAALAESTDSTLSSEAAASTAAEGNSIAEAGQQGKNYNLYRMPKNKPGQSELVATIPDAKIMAIYTVPGYEKLFVETRRKEKNGDALNGDAFYYLTELALVGIEDGDIMWLELPER